MATMAEIGAALGHPTRARALETLASGRYLAMTELARLCRVPASSMSEHLGILLERGLLRQMRSGRHRYFTLASSEVAHLIEAAGIVATSRPPARTLRDAERERFEQAGRFCWHHLAGRLAVEFRDLLIAGGALDSRSDDAIVTPRGAEMLATQVGVSVEAGLIAPACVDYTERRLHLRGTLGAALTKAFIDQGWVRRGPGRAAILTEPGRDVVLRLQQHLA